jgi:hypothetical protein
MGDAGGDVMDPQPLDHDPVPGPPTPGALLDALRDHPEWTEGRRDEQFDRLIAHFPAEELVAAARARLRDLRGGDGEMALRLVEALGSPAVLEELAEALVAQGDLAPERTWEALSLLQGTGLIEAHPELAERWDDLAEALDDAQGSLELLVAQIEADPDDAWVALQGLGAVEPEIRAQIVAELGRQPLGPGLIAFLRILAFAHEPGTRSAALAALTAGPVAEPLLGAAWVEIAADHPDPDVVARAHRWLGGRGDSAPRPLAPRIVTSLITAVDGRGQGYLVLEAEDRGRWTAAAFLCDVLRGVREVIGQTGRGPEEVGECLAEFAARPEADVVEGVPELTLGLLAGSLRLCGPRTTPALRFWLERTVGPSFRARPFPGLAGAPDPADVPLDELPRRAEAVLDSCPSWVDDSDLTYDLAEELLLRDGDSPPVPRRDAGAYRFLFEHRLGSRLELYRRMLTWMAWFWHASGDLDLGRSALVLAEQLADAQHAVPGHPFTVALTTRSLAAAQENLRQGIDPRRKKLNRTED